MSVFACRIKQMLRLRPEQVWTVHRAVTRNTTARAPVLIPHYSVVTAHPHTNHAPATSVGRQMAYSDIDTDRVT